MDLIGAEPAARSDVRARRRDLQLAAAFLAGGGLLFSFGAYQHGRSDPSALVLIPLVVGGAALLLRRIAPLPAVVIGALAFTADQVLGPSIAMVLVFAELLYDACLYGKDWVVRRVLVAMAAATVAIACVTLALLRVPDALTLAVNAAVLLLLPPFTALEVRRYRDRATAEKLRADQLARLAELDRQQAVVAERARMARELHDVVANHLSVIAIHATGARSVGRDLDPQVSRALAVIRENSVRGLAEMRQMIELLRDPNGGDEQLRPRLEEIDRLIAYARDAGLAVTVTGAVDPDRPLPVATDLAAYRVVQESLTNAVKHASGGSVDVTIAHESTGLAVTVASSGGAPAVVPSSGLGLTGLQERVALLGGAFEAGPRDGGFRVHAELPS